MGNSKHGLLFPAFAILSLCLPHRAHAVHFPDTSDLKKSYRVSARKDGRPVEFFRKADGDSFTVRLEWAGKSLASVRLEQGSEIDPDSFTVLTSAYGNGAAWHESMGNRDPQLVKKYPGLEQEWVLKGYGGEKGWLGSGLERGRFFLVFRDAPPMAMAAATGPLRLNPKLFAFLDTSSHWLHVECKDGKKPDAGSKPVCFSPTEDSRYIVRIDSRKPLSLQAWMDEGESEALSDIKNALKSLPDAAQADYAKDLSQMLLGEGQMFLVKLAQRLPEAFTWPSWQLQDFKGGQIPSEEFLPVVRRQAQAGEFLPALRFQDPGIRLSVNLYYRGRFHLSARELP
jgi:hypothetical protein